MEPDNVSFRLDERIKELKQTIKSLQKTVDALEILRDQHLDKSRKSEKKKKQDALNKVMIRLKRKELKKPGVFQVYNLGFEVPESIRDIDYAEQMNLDKFVDLLGHANEEANKGKSNLQSNAGYLEWMHENATEGDIIDTDGYRGVGLFYVFNKDGERYVQHTQEEYGYMLPEVALPFIVKTGFQNQEEFSVLYDNLDIYGIMYQGEMYPWVDSPPYDENESFYDPVNFRHIK